VFCPKYEIILLVDLILHSLVLYICDITAASKPTYSFPKKAKQNNKTQHEHYQNNDANIDI